MQAGQTMHQPDPHFIDKLCAGAVGLGWGCVSFLEHIDLWLKVGTFVVTVLSALWYGSRLFMWAYKIAVCLYNRWKK